MEILIAIFGIVVMPLLMGYIYGGRLLDPNTAEGKRYYAGKEI